MIQSTLLAFVAATLLASAVEAQGTSADQTFLDFQVERAVRIKQASAPIYPDRLRNARVDGEVLVQFVVDENGEAQMGTFKVIKSSNPAFTEAVKRSVGASTFHPAEVDGKKVRQLVQLPYKFNYRR